MPVGTRTVLLYLLMLIASQACVSPPREMDLHASDSTVRAQDERAVHIAAIEGVLANPHPPVVLVQAFRVAWFGDSTVVGQRGPLWEDFVKQARTRGRIQTLSLDVPFLMTTAGLEVGRVATDTILIGLSGVGFSPRGDEAMVYVDVRCGPGCDVASIQTFRLDHSTWQSMGSDTIRRR